MTDLITAEEIEALKADLRPMNGCDIFDRAYAAIASLHAQLADAQAAQAMWIEALESDLLDRVIEGSVWSMPEGTRATDEWRRGVTDARRDITAAVKLTFLTLAPIDGLALVRGLRAEIADLSLNMDADLKTMVREGEQLRTLAAELAAAQQREAALSDPICVHVNMLRGTIAKPTIEQIIHLYGVDALCRALVPPIVREAGNEKA